LTCRNTTRACALSVFDAADTPHARSVGVWRVLASKSRFVGVAGWSGVARGSNDSGTRDVRHRASQRVSARAPRCGVAECVRHAGEGARAHRIKVRRDARARARVRASQHAGTYMENECTAALSNRMTC
jgi:hypothetical protein